VALEFGEDVVQVEVVTLKERVGAERYRELRRVAGEHLPVPSVLVEYRLVSPGIPEQDELRRVFKEALAAAGTRDATQDSAPGDAAPGDATQDSAPGDAAPGDAGGPPC